MISPEMPAVVLTNHAAAGHIRVENETIPLSSVREAWERQTVSAHRKLILTPQPKT